MVRIKFSFCFIVSSLLFLFAPASMALPINFYDSGNNLNNTGSNGTMPDNVPLTAHSFTFSLANDVILTDVGLQLDLLTFDHNFSIAINGTTIVPEQLDSHNPALFSPSVIQPWYENIGGLPRLRVEITNQYVNFWATLTVNSNAMTSVSYLTQIVLLPSFQLGSNTIVLTNPNGIGPDGIDFTLNGDDGKNNPVPEPATMLLFGAGLASLAGIRLKNHKK